MILSFDIGTTNIKALVYDGNHVFKRYEVAIKTTNHTQDVDEIVSKIRAIIKDAKVSKIIFTTAMHTLILLDENMNVIAPMYLWSSNLGDVKKYDFYDRTGVPQHSMTPFYKLLALNGYQKASDLKGYLMYELTGNWVSDYSNACASGMFNLLDLKWDEEIISMVGLTVDDLPIVMPIDTVYQGEGYEIVLGSSDGVMANYGIQEHFGDLIISIGTSVAVRKLSKVRNLNTKGFCYSAGTNYLIGSSSNNGGNLFETFGISFEEMITYLFEPLTNCFVTPYVYGERGPWYLEDLKYEVLLNEPLAMKDRVQSLILAMFSNVEIMMQELKFGDSTVYVTGGFLRDERLLQLFANFLNRDIMYVLNEDAVCRGNMLLVMDLEPLHYIRCSPNLDRDLLAYKKISKALIRSKILDID